jgi:hypothetical protein
MGRVLEQASGVGEVYEGDKKLGTARYSITVYQEMLDVGRGQEIDGLCEISGLVEAQPPLNGFSLAMKDGPLSLRLTDGRWWDFVVRDSDGMWVPEILAG